MHIQEYFQESSAPCSVGCVVLLLGAVWFVLAPFHSDTAHADLCTSCMNGGSTRAERLRFSITEKAETTRKNPAGRGSIDARSNALSAPSNLRRPTGHCKGLESSLQTSLTLCCSVSKMSVPNLQRLQLRHFSPDPCQLALTPSTILTSACFSPNMREISNLDLLQPGHSCSITP